MSSIFFIETPVKKFLVYYNGERLLGHQIENLHTVGSFPGRFTIKFSQLKQIYVNIILNNSALHELLNEVQLIKIGEVVSEL